MDVFRNAIYTPPPQKIKQVVLSCPLINTYLYSPDYDNVIEKATDMIPYPTNNEERGR